MWEKNQHQVSKFNCKNLFNPWELYNCRQSERKPNYFDVFLNMHYLLKKYLWVVARIHIVLICNMESLWFVIINFLLLIMYSAVSLYFCSFSLGKVLSLLWIIIKVISIVPIQHTRWEPRSIYSNTNNTHTNTQMGDRHGCEKDRQCMNMQTNRQTLSPSRLRRLPHLLQNFWQLAAAQSA